MGRFSNNSLNGVVRPAMVATLLCMLLPRTAPAQGETRILDVPPFAFTAASAGYQQRIEQGGLGRLCTAKAGYFVAPLDLPDGAFVERISAVVEDVNEDCFAMLTLARRTGDEVEVLGATPISNGPPLRREALSASLIPQVTVDRAHSTYVLQAVLTGPGVCLRSAQVMYHRP